MRSTHFLRFSAALSMALAFPCLGHAQEQAHLEIDSPFASFVEEGFPYFAQTLDARNFGENPEPQNLAPRGIIVKAGNGYFGCFDPDLLRWALFWKANEAGEYLTMDGMAPGSYRFPNRKASAGQKNLPRPIGSVLYASPPALAWSTSSVPEGTDPRDRGTAEAEEIGLGPIPAELGRFSGIRLTESGLFLEYTIDGTAIRERLSSEKGHLFRDLEVAPHREILHLHTGAEGNPWHSLEPSDKVQNVRIILGDSGAVKIEEGSSFADSPPPQRFWEESVTTEPAQTVSGPIPAALVYDDFPPPLPNPWKRNVRLSGFDFYPDGRAAFCTYDGDVWIVSGLSDESGESRWTPFASGLHEPQSLSLVDGVIHVFDRNGIVRLHDTDKNGEADWYENFSNVVSQTAETREFAMDMVAASDGSFYLAKGGQIGSTIGKRNGTVVRVSRDGLSYEVVSTGLRQPYLGYDPETGILTASDQQGNWKPGTPLYRIEPGRYFGFQPEKFKENAVHPTPIDPAEIWIPHFVNQSGAGQVWLKRPGNEPAGMGAYNGSLIHIGFNRPEIFKIYLDEAREQGAIVPLLSGFPAGLLKGRVHPLDGLLYLCGMEIWGTSGERITGLFRVRPGEAQAWIPREAKAEERGILLAFDHSLAPELATEISRFSVDRWNYRQTHQYGSGNFKLDGEPGQESVAVTSAKLSRDGKSLFIGLAGMAPSDTLRLTYRLPVVDSMQVENIYFTVRSLPGFNLTSVGFADNEVDLTRKAELTSHAEPIEPSVEIGREVSLRYGCVACHATGDPAHPPPLVAAADSAQSAVGPSWVGLWKSARTFTDGSSIKSADEAYLRESILDPSRRVSHGYEMEKTGVGMPSYLGVLKDHEIDSILLYIETLKGK